MKITAISVQLRDKSRVNVSVDGRYRFSLDIIQVADLGIRIGKEYTEEELTALEEESQFGKLYTRSLEYCLVRPRSRREIEQYLYKKTRPTRRKDGSVKEGVSVALTERVFDRLNEKGYINDEKFARFWVENRNVRKGSSLRKLRAELMTKGVKASIIDEVLSETDRSDENEIDKILEKKYQRYDDPQKLMAYLARQGFGYDDIKEAIDRYEAR